MMPCQGPWGGGYGADSDKDDYLEAERRLCEARWMLLRFAESAPVPKALNALFNRHRLEQLKHRKGDQRHVIERIDATLERLRENMGEVVRLGGEPSAAWKKQIETLQRERIRIKAITDEQLLADYWGTEKRLTSDLVDHE